MGMMGFVKSYSTCQLLLILFFLLIVLHKSLMHKWNGREKKEVTVSKYTQI